jgi:hypothetical protein
MNLECKVLPGIGCTLSTRERIGRQYIEMTKNFRKERIKGYMSEKIIANYERIIAEKRRYFPDFIKGRIEKLQIQIDCCSDKRYEKQVALNFWLKKQKQYA